MTVIDWQVVERKRQEAEREELRRAVGELKSKAALLNELSKTAGWQCICELLRNTAAAKQQEAMKAGDPTTLARAFGYMASCNDIINLPASMAQQLESQLASLQQSQQLDT